MTLTGTMTDIRETTFDDGYIPHLIELEFDYDDQINVFGKKVKGWPGYKRFDSVPKVGDEVELGEIVVDNIKWMFSHPVSVIKFKEPSTVKRVVVHHFTQKKKVWTWLGRKEIEVNQERYSVEFGIPDSTELVELDKDTE